MHLKNTKNKTSNFSANEYYEFFIQQIVTNSNNFGFNAIYFSFPHTKVSLPNTGMDTGPYFPDFNSEELSRILQPSIAL